MTHPGPEIRAKIAPQNRPAGGLFDGDSPRRGARPLSGQGLMKRRVALGSETATEFFDGEGEKGSDISHKGNCIPPESMCNPSIEYSPKSYVHDARWMEPWPQREQVKAALKNYSRETGKKQAEIADYLGISTSHLRNSLYGDKRLSFEILQRIAAMVGCSVTRFIDDAGANPDLADMTDEERFWANTMLQDYRAEDLSPEDRRILFEDFQRGLERLRLLKMRLGK